MKARHLLLRAPPDRASAQPVRLAWEPQGPLAWVRIPLQLPERTPTECRTAQPTRAPQLRHREARPGTPAPFPTNQFRKHGRLGELAQAFIFCVRAEWLTLHVVSGFCIR